MATKARKLRAVLDTNVFIASYLSKNPKSPTVELLGRWKKGELILLHCEELQREAARKLVEKE